MQGLELAGVILFGGSTLLLAGYLVVALALEKRRA